MSAPKLDMAHLLGRYQVSVTAQKGLSLHYFCFLLSNTGFSHLYDAAALWKSNELHTKQLVCTLITITDVLIFTSYFPFNGLASYEALGYVILQSF